MMPKTFDEYCSYAAKQFLISLKPIINKVRTSGNEYVKFAGRCLNGYCFVGTGGFGRICGKSPRPKNIIDAIKGRIDGYSKLLDLINKIIAFCERGERCGAYCIKAIRIIDMAFSLMKDTSANENDHGGD